MNFSNNQKHITHVLALLAGMCLLAILFIWFKNSPQEQVTKHQQKLLEAIADKKWRVVRSLVSPSYQDRFGHNHDKLVANLQDVTLHFFVLTIRAQGTEAQFKTPRQADVSTNLTISGTGSGLTDLISTEVNRLQKPWTFIWVKTGAFPWSWQLTSVDNPSLNLDSYQSAAGM